MKTYQCALGNVETSLIEKVENVFFINKHDCQFRSIALNQMTVKETGERDFSKVWVVLDSQRAAFELSKN